MTLAILVLITFISSLVISLTGFGFALVAMSVFPLFMTMEEANVLVTVLALPVIAINLFPAWRAVKLRILLPVLLSTAFALPLGIWFLVRLDERFLLIGLGAVILLALFANSLGSHNRIIKPSIWAAVVFGSVSGAFGGAYSTSGPPITLYFSRILTDKNELKANQLAHFLFVVIIKLTVFGFGGFITGELVKRALFLLIPLLFGMVAGVFLFKYLSSEWVRLIVSLFLGFSSIIMIVRAI